MASENIMLDAVKRGGDRQELHERIRVHAMAAGKRVKEDGLDNDLIDRICADSAFGLTHKDAEALLEPSKYTGRSAEQVEEFISTYIDPLLKTGAIAEQTELFV